MSQPNKYVLAFLVVVALGGTCIWIGIQWLNTPTHIHSDWTIDRSNDRELAGASHNIFFGQVIRRSGRKSLHNWGPQAQFEVEVFEVIKGDLSGSVTVNQPYYPGEDRLQKDKSYFFATRSSNLHDWHTAIHQYGEVNLDVPDDAEKDTVLSSTLANEYRDRFTEAVENEIPYFYDGNRE